MSLEIAIKALERMRDADGTLILNSDQSMFLIFLLWDVFESKPKDIQFAVLDLLGTLDLEEKQSEESA